MATTFQSSQRSPAASNEEFVPVGAGAQRARADRQHPAARNHARDRGAAAPRRADFRQARGLQSRRFGQGPSRAPHDRARPEARRAASGQDDHRFDLGQHRDRAGDGRRGARLPGRDRDGLQRQPRAQEDNRGLRRQADLLRSAGRLRRRDRAVPQDHRRQSRALLQARPVQQRGQPARPLRNHRTRNLASDRAAGSLISSPESAPAAP